jgi:hypothetical protein
MYQLNGFHNIFILYLHYMEQLLYLFSQVIIRSPVQKEDIERVLSTKFFVSCTHFTLTNKIKHHPNNKYIQKETTTQHQPYANTRQLLQIQNDEVW